MIASTNPTDFISVGTACRLYSLSAPTLRKLVDDDPSLVYRTVGNHRRIIKSRLEAHLGLVSPEESRLSRSVMVAIRVSTRSQLTSLEYQRERCLAWCKENLPDHNIIVNERVCSGLYLSHPSFISIILSIVNQEVSDIVCLHQDRLARGAMDMLKELMEQFNVKLHILEEKPNKSYGESLSEDILAFIGSHHARYQGQKAKAKLEITVDDDKLLMIYKQYKRGMSFKDLSRWCNSNNIVGRQDGKVVPLSAAKLHQILNRNQKLLEELVPFVDSDINKFVKLHLKSVHGAITKQVDIYAKYQSWCDKEGVTPLSAKKMGKGIAEAGVTPGRALGGMKVFKDVSLCEV